jgi:cytochrome c
MRTYAALVLALAVTGLTACGKGSEQASTASSTPNTTTASAPSAQVVPSLDTPENKKLVAELGPTFANADLANGQTRFALCRSCHTIAKGGPNMTGPNLYGIFGRKAGAVADYAYSEGLKGSGVTWSAETLDLWLKDPRAMVAGTKMSFIGVKDDKDRADLIAYLKVASNGGAN